MNKSILLVILSIVCTLALDIPNTIDKAKYPTVINLDGEKLKMYYVIDEEKGEIEVALECQCTGYFGWGISNSKGMVNSDVYLGSVTGTTVEYLDYRIVAQKALGCPSGVCLDTLNSGTNDILAFNGNEAAGVTQLIMIRKLISADSNDISIAKGTQQTLIYSYRETNKVIDQHDKTPTPILLDFFSGGQAKLINLQVVHGALMFISWFVIAPFGFFLARFMKSFSWWFQVHRAIMLVAMAALIAGFGVIVSSTTEHFNNAHKIIGLIVTIIGASQPLFGFLADKFYKPDRPATPIFPDKVHWVLGWVSIALGMINILLGLIEYDFTAPGVLIAYCVIGGGVLLFCIGFSIFRLIKPSDEKGHGSDL